MKIETIKLQPKKEVNACSKNEITALKSIEFKCTDYPEIQIKTLRLNTCGDKDCQKEEVDLWLKIRVSVSRNELFDLLGAIKHDDELWREEDLPCRIKIEVDKKSNMDYWKEAGEGRNE